MKETKRQKKINKMPIKTKIIGWTGLSSFKRTSADGITLIALVITIIVLLILAGVAIGLTLGDNGIFTKAEEARDKNERATLIEKIQTEILEKQLANEETSISKGELETILSKYGDIQKDNKKNIKGLKLEGKEETIPIEDIIGNTKVITINPGESGFEGGTYNEPYIPKGFKYKGEGTWNSGYTIIGETTSVGDEFVWVPCIITEKQIEEAQANEDIVQIFQKKLNYPANAGLTVTGDEQEASYIEESVENYGGFYIAKYEAGIPDTTKSVTTNHNTSIAGDKLPVSKPNVGVWNFINRTNALQLSNKMIDNTKTGVYSTLISGAAWDTTLQWIINSSKDNAGYDTNSASKGNYSGAIASTGSKPAYSINNIYDMAGNVWEWTTENCTCDGSSKFVVRGRILQYWWSTLCNGIPWT